MSVWISCCLSKYEIPRRRQSIFLGGAWGGSQSFWVRAQESSVCVGNRFKMNLSNVLDPRNLKQLFIHADWDFGAPLAVAQQLRDIPYQGGEYAYVHSRARHEVSTLCVFLNAILLIWDFIFRLDS